ncbi:OmpA family protein [Pantoea piersonii]|uniref:OmpA family protein n=1 Tax=Pantoea piersonii TaxID=2364647 RepID=UPI0028AE1AC4|nr:OmpA family protein [Pantoea piersonii]
MSATQHRILALWFAVLASLVCLAFLPLSRRASFCLLLVIWLLAGAAWFWTRRQQPLASSDLSALPDAAYRQPVVLVCGDLAQSWPDKVPVITSARGCWIQIRDGLALDQVVEQLLRQRPEWGRQLSVMITVSPQQHADMDRLTSHLLALRWQLARLRRITRQSVPLILHGLVGMRMVNETLWLSTTPEEGSHIWREGQLSSSVAPWIATGSTVEIEQQVLMNSLTAWFRQHIAARFTEPHPDIPSLTPAAMLCRIEPYRPDVLPASLWTNWLQQRTAITQAAGWQPAENHRSLPAALPDFILPLLPEGSGITSRQRAWRAGFTLFILAAIAALCSSAWSNHQLLQRGSADIRHYNRIAMDDVGAKRAAVEQLRQDAAQLDLWARNGEPLRLSLGLYRGERLYKPLLNAIRSYMPPASPAPAAKPAPHPTIVRLDSLSLFNPGKAELRPGSTKVLVNALVDIKARPGWLIVITGHTDNTGNPKLNQTLSLKRAEAVRGWMRDTGDVPESCFAVQGYGDSRPVADNSTAEGRALNRRVEISLVPQADACLVPDTPLASSEDGVNNHETE